jgi:pyruvate/2-oxoglutarate dehydrogenase complex dihydrolipoamide dehydrogenase (E3) component
MLLEQGDHLLAKEDPEAGNLVQGALEKSGVEVRCRTRLASVEMLPGPVRRLVLESSTPSPDPARQEKVVEVDAILVAVGRAPNVEGLGLEQAGVRTSPAGVAVDDYLRTSNRRIFAVGDIASAFKFTHAADALARVAIRNALFLGRSKASHLTIPWCTYTDPEVAHVGLSLRRARDAGMPIRTFEQRLDQVDRAILDGDEEGFIRIHTAADSDRILGATIVARHAGDLIGEITLAMRHQVGLGGIASVIHPYPTQADGIRRLGDAYQRTRLTPTVAKLFRAWLAWCRSY